MKTIVSLYRWFDTATIPMLYWPYGQDGKYRHILLGIIVSTLTIFVSIVMRSEDLNSFGISLAAMIAGIALERLQRLFGGNNTFFESVSDVAWTWFGGVLIGILAALFGLARLFY